MAKPPATSTTHLILKLNEDIQNLAGQVRSIELTKNARRKFNSEVERATLSLNSLLTELDPIERPHAVFDPGNPRTIAFFIALALTAQKRQPLRELRPFYGSGVYAIYYSGSLPFYAPLARTETPIYVGQAAPANENARTPTEQGIRLVARLNEHRKNIERASATLNVDDFQFRTLIVQTGWETGAENYLIRLFKPIWNKETGLVYGIGKHGDSAQTRKNKISPWDTLHKGRNWTGEEILAAKKSLEKIEIELAEHFNATPVFQTEHDVLAAFLNGLRQL